jgi:hypothetical protein
MGEAKGRVAVHRATVARGQPRRLVQQFGKVALLRPDMRVGQALGLEQDIGIMPGLPLVADTVGDGYADIVEFDTGELVRSVDQADRMDTDPRQVERGANQRNALLLALLAAGAREAEDPVGP